MHEVPVDVSVRGSRWPEQWPKRLEKPPYWLNSKVGVYGKGAKRQRGTALCPQNNVASYRIRNNNFSHHTGLTHQFIPFIRGLPGCLY